MPKRNNAQPDVSAGTALGVLFDETVLLYFRLTADAAAIHGQGMLSGPRRTVLASLDRSGPLTVAQMARARGQSRQRFQPLVNRLLAEGLVEAKPNPRHKASPLIALTTRGGAEVRRSIEREAALRERLIVASTPKSLLQAAAILHEVREASEAQLPALLAAAPGRRRTKDWGPSTRRLALRID